MLSERHGKENGYYYWTHSRPGQLNMLKQNILGILTLFIAVVALGLAVIPGIALDRPVQILPKPEPVEAPLPTETKGGMTLRYKGFSVNLGGRTKPVDEPPTVTEARQAEAESDKMRDNWLRNCTLAAGCCSLLAAVLGPFAWVKEKQPAITAPAMVIATVALTWQFIAVGIAVGVGLAVLLIIISLIG